MLSSILPDRVVALAAALLVVTAAGAVLAVVAVATSSVTATGAVLTVVAVATSTAAVIFGRRQRRRRTWTFAVGGSTTAGTVHPPCTAFLVGATATT